MENLLVNFTYDSPHVDIELCAEFDSRGNIDIEKTLTKFKQRLEDNVELINKLLDYKTHIINICPINYGQVAIMTNSPQVSTQMIDAKLVSRYTYSTDTDSDNEFDRVDIDPSELLHINNDGHHPLTTIEEIDEECPLLSDTDNEDLIVDEKNMIELLDKYNKFIIADDDDDKDNTDEGK